jgi:hypothetical protein
VAIPSTREALLKAIDESYAKLARELDAIPMERVDERTLEGHVKTTRMSVRDLVAYLTGWGELVLKWHDGRRAGMAVDFPETGFKWNELGRLAQKFYGDYDALTYEELRLRLTQSKDRIRAIVASTTDEALYGVPWYEKWTPGRMVQFNTSSPYANARARLRAWQRSWTAK